MTVVPGKGGQKLIFQTLEKIKKLKEYIYENDLEIDIEADGGINDETVNDVKETGVDIIVSGNYVIASQDYKNAISKLRED